MKNKILLIEDEEQMSLFLTQLLSSSFEVIPKEDGFEALLWMKDFGIPDLIIADLHMPHMDGFELIARIKSNKLYRNIPVIIVSANHQIEIKNKCLKIGANAYFEKPIDVKLFMSRVCQLLEISSYAA